MVRKPNQNRLLTAHNIAYRPHRRSSRKSVIRQQSEAARACIHTRSHAHTPLNISDIILMKLQLWRGPLQEKAKIKHYDQ